MIRTGKDGSELVRNDQDWSGMIRIDHAPQDTSSSKGLFFCLSDPLFDLLNTFGITKGPRLKRTGNLDLL